MREPRRLVTTVLPLVAVGLALLAILGLSDRSKVPTAPGQPSTAAQPSTQAVQPTDLLPPTYWESKFLEGWTGDQAERITAMSKSGDSWDQYELAYWIDANTAMYLATDKTQYLDRALSYADNLVTSARVSRSFPTSQYQDGYLGWVTQQAEERGQEIPLYESYCWRYIVRMLWDMQQDPRLLSQPSYRGQFARLLSFAEVNIFDKWFDRGADDNIYRSRTHMAAHWAYIGVYLAELTQDKPRRAKANQVVDNINRHLPNYKSSLRQQLRANPRDRSAYYWSDLWGSDSRPGQDVSHGNGLIAYIVESHDQGREWTDEDVSKFIGTLAVVLPARGPAAEYVDGTGRDNGWIADGFVKLGRYDARLQKRLETYQPAADQYYANMALNARLLAKKSVAAEVPQG